MHEYEYKTLCVFVCRINVRCMKAIYFFHVSLPKSIFGKVVLIMHLEIVIYLQSSCFFEICHKGGKLENFMNKQ